MLFALHHMALEEYLLGRSDAFQYGIVGSAIIGVTDKLLDEYDLNLSKNLAYLPWFTAAQAKKRIRVISRSEFNHYGFPNLTSANIDYLPSSFFCGLNFVISKQLILDSADATKFLEYGIEILELSKLTDCPFYGDNPISIINLKDGGTTDLVVVSRYFKNENKVLIYDKFIDNDSLDVIEACCTKLAANANVTILMKDDKGCLNSSIILRRLQTKLPSIKFSCYIVSPKTASKYHDRFFFIGNRLQIEFSRGANCFIKTGDSWINKDGRVIVYDCFDKTFQKKYEFVLASGKKFISYGFGK